MQGIELGYALGRNIENNSLGCGESIWLWQTKKFALTNQSEKCMVGHVSDYLRKVIYSIADSR